MLKVIEAGTKVAAFTVKDQNDNEISMEKYPGKRLLFSFHPLAWTGICTQQMKALDARYDEFEALGVVPFGVSVDAAPTKRAWAESMGIKKLPLVIDFWPHGAFAEALDIFIEKNGTSGRANIVIGPDGTVVWAKAYHLSEMPDFDEVLDALKK